MSARTPRLAAALLVLLASALLARAAPGGTPADTRDDEPLARALLPLGPVRAIVASALWVQLLQGQMAGDADETSAVARALLALHPALTTVREYLAGQLLVTEAPRAPDPARHDALVATGLALFEEGLALPGGERLRAPFGRTLAVQSMVDARFPVAAERVLGELPEERALAELLRSGPHGFDRWLAASLAVDRGLRAWRLDGDRAAASRDLALAGSLLPRTEEEALASGFTSSGDGADEIIARADRLLAPLREALESAAPPARGSAAEPLPEDPSPR